jgi:pilus assembly protein CpaF
MIKLTITEKGGEPKALSFDKDDVTIGRVSGNDIVLPKGNVSKRHSRLSVRNGQVEIADLKSTNGTYVNGRKIGEPMLLSASDRVYVGDFLITIEGLAGVEGASASRRMPVPPPPPPPPLPGTRTGSSSVKGPSDDTGMGGEDEEEMPAPRPPRSSGRMSVPPPPPPPPRRQPTPLASQALEDEDEALAGDLAPPAPREVNAADENTGSAGLFERRPAEDHSAFDGAGGRPLATGPRPGAALSADAGPAAYEAPSAGGGESAAGEGLEALFADPAVTQILVAGPDSIYVDRGTGLAPLSGGLGDLNAVADALWRIANAAVPPPPPDNPVVDVRLPDGTRVAAVFPPAALGGVAASIKKPVLAERALSDLVPPGAKELQTLLDAAVATQRNLLCSGDAVAVAALLAAIAGAIPADRRVASIGGTLPRPRAGWTELAATADMPGLVRVATSLRPDHLLVAEPVSSEALDLLVAGTRGQEGLAFAVPARAPGEALARLEALAMPALGPAGAASVAALVASTVDLVVHAVTSADGSSRVVEVSEPFADDATGRTGAEPVATWRGDGGRRGGSGKLQVEGVSARLGAAFAAAGTALPSSLVRK